LPGRFITIRVYTKASVSGLDTVCMPTAASVDGNYLYKLRVFGNRVLRGTSALRRMEKT
jgi:glycerol dehydrogenase-like iron-containing ADH family enzyme